MARLLRATRIPAALAALGLVSWLALDSEAAAAQLFAVALLLLVTLILFTTGPERPVALHKFSSVPAAGLEVPADALEDGKAGVDYKYQHGLFFRGLVLGEDGRWSTSKLQVLMWTYAVLFALASIFLAAALGAGDGLRSLRDQQSSEWDVYLILLGGPFAALVLAQGITSAKVSQGKVAKTPSTQTTDVVTGLTEVISNDAGETDIVDLQYFLFNLLALLFFLLAFVPDLSSGLPELPAFLAVLTGASAATYVGKKAAEHDQPSITAVLPAKVRRGDTFDIWGHSLLAGPSVEERIPEISIGATRITEIGIVDDTLSGLDHLQCKLPIGVTIGPDTLRIVTRAGVSTEVPLEALEANPPAPTS